MCDFVNRSSSSDDDERFTKSHINGEYSVKISYFIKRVGIGRHSKLIKCGVIEVTTFLR